MTERAALCRPGSPADGYIAKGAYVATVRGPEAALRALARAEAGLPAPPIGVEP